MLLYTMSLTPPTRRFAHHRFGKIDAVSSDGLEILVRGSGGLGEGEHVYSDYRTHQGLVFERDKLVWDPRKFWTHESCLSMIAKEEEVVKERGFVTMMRDSGTLHRSGMGRAGGNEPIPLELVNDIKRASVGRVNKLQVRELGVVTNEERSDEQKVPSCVAERGAKRQAKGS